MKQAIIQKISVLHIYDGTYPSDLDQFKDAKEGTEEHKYYLEDQKSLESWRQNKWHYIGIRIKAEILIPMDNNGNWLHQTITTGGLWQIESKCGDKYKKEVATEQLDELKHICEVLNINTQRNKPFDNQPEILPLDQLFAIAVKSPERDY